MTCLPTRAARRRGLTLLEVVVSMAILLASVVALTQLVSTGSRRALEVRQQALGTMLAQRKLAEVTVGATPLNSTGYTAFDEDGLDHWQWKLDASQGNVNGLWNVQVTVKFDAPAGNDESLEVQLGQMVLDPTLRGSSLDTPPAQGTSSSSGSSSGSATPSSGSTPAGSGQGS